MKFEVVLKEIVKVKMGWEQHWLVENCLVSFY